MKKQQLPCLHDGCFAFASWVAMNNIPYLGHVCTECFKMIPESEQVHYARISTNAIQSNAAK